MPDIDIRCEGAAGRITLTRPDALNALTHQMALAIHQALRDWAADDAVQLVLIDAAGSRGFCAGGDVTAMYDSHLAGDQSGPRQFWADEYRMNAAIAAYPKPIVSFLHGFVMGGGVGVGCHASHRIAGESTQIAMPECGIGLVPDVGGSLILANAPGRLGEYLALTATRMGAADAIYTGFADHFVPEADWPALKLALIAGDVGAVQLASREATQGHLQGARRMIDQTFSGEALGDIERALRADPSEFSQRTLASMARNSPLSMAVSVEMMHRLRGATDIRRALELEYRFTFRALTKSDFIEGVRAAIIDKDRAPKWRHAGRDVPTADSSAMLQPLGVDTLKFEETAS